MILRKNILITLFIILGFVRAFATPQIPDRLIYNGDTIYVVLYLPDEFYGVSGGLSVNLFDDKKVCGGSTWVTNCGRGYVSRWEIVENQLYLTGIYSCCYYQDSVKADLTSLFKERVIAGKVKADWVTGNIPFQKGKIITRIYTEPFYETDFEFEFSEGKLLYIKSYDNSKSRISFYSQNYEKLIDFLYSNIDWDKLPIPEKRIRVFVKFSANEEGKVDRVEIMRGDDEIFNQEAIRVVKLIPDWDVLYIRGNHYRLHQTIAFVFSEENRVKYGK